MKAPDSNTPSQVSVSYVKTESSKKNDEEFITFYQFMKPVLIAELAATFAGICHAQGRYWLEASFWLIIIVNVIKWLLMARRMLQSFKDES